MRFLLALPPGPNTRLQQINEAEQKLKDLFKVENIAPGVLDDYFAGLKVDDPNVSLRKFVDGLSKIFPDDGQSIFDNLLPTPLVFDDRVSETLQLTVDEASVCYKHECYLATIVLCGKIIETLLANAFQVLIGKPPNEKMRFGQVRQALRGKGMPLEDHVDELLSLIYTHRSVVVHSSGGFRDVSFPTKGQADGVAALTQEVINIIYEYFNNEGK